MKISVLPIPRILRYGNRAALLNVFNAAARDGVTRLSRRLLTHQQSSPPHCRIVIIVFGKNPIGRFGFPDGFVDRSRRARFSPRRDRLADKYAGAHNVDCPTPRGNQAVSFRSRHLPARARFLFLLVRFNSLSSRRNYAAAHENRLSDHRSSRRARINNNNRINIILFRWCCRGLVCKRRRFVCERGRGHKTATAAAAAATGSTNGTSSRVARVRRAVAAEGEGSGPVMNGPGAHWMPATGSGPGATQPVISNNSTQTAPLAGPPARPDRAGRHT